MSSKAESPGLAYGSTLSTAAVKGAAASTQSPRLPQLTAQQRDAVERCKQVMDSVYGPYTPPARLSTAATDEGSTRKLPSASSASSASSSGSKEGVDQQQQQSSPSPAAVGSKDTGGESKKSTAGSSASYAWRPKGYPHGHKGRYLWTDAYGVCNFLTLFRVTGEDRYLHQARILVDEVHETLGRVRGGSGERLEGATDDCPVAGGLRIGKVHSENHRDGDGQYFHYLTKWAFALNRMACVTGEQRYNDWAVSLIKAIHPKFVYSYGDRSKLHMYWKMSINLARPLVPSEGNLDAFDGYVTYRQVQELCAQPAVLAAEVEDMKTMVESRYRQYRSRDPLDLGEALWITSLYPNEPWAQRITAVSLAALDAMWEDGFFLEDPEYRLAFREFGTTIGVQVNKASDEPWQHRVEAIHRFWQPLIFQRDQDITPVMYCTSLLPGVLKREC